MKFLYKGVKVSQLQRSFNKFLTRPILWSVYKSFIESNKPICGCFIELSSVKHVWVLILTLGLFFFATFVFLEENNLYILFDNAPVEYNILIIIFYHYSWFIFGATVVHIWSLLTDMQVVSINPLHSGLFHSNYVNWGVTNHINYGFTP